MNILKIEEEWLQEALPEDFPCPSSTLISGPGGTGKPLVEFAFVSSWLTSDGAVENNVYPI
jgi:archaellum biogenesis ATPase FlaH